MLWSVEYPTQSQACVRKASHFLPSAFIGTYRISVNGIPTQSNWKILGYEHQTFSRAYVKKSRQPLAPPRQADGNHGILHAICHGEAREMMGINTAYVQMYYLMTKLIAPDSIMARILSSCVPLGPAAHAKVIEDSEDVESAYRTAALRGETGVPENAEDEVDFHYVCFVKSSKTGYLYELDGDRKGPVDHGILKAGEDFLSGRALSIIENFISREKGQNVISACWLLYEEQRVQLRSVELRDLDLNHE